MSIKSWCKKEKALLLLVSISLFFQILFLAIGKDLWWDSYIYAAMGKYLFSWGEVGFWEVFRPPLYSLVLGAIWLLKLPIISFGKAFNVLFLVSAQSILYVLIKEKYGQKIAFWATMIVIISPISIFYAGQLLTEPLVLLLSMGGLYLFIKNKHLFSGILFALAALTKFPFGLFFIGALIGLLSKKEWKNCTSLITGFALITAPYLIMNYVIYANPFAPLIQGSAILKTGLNHYETSNLTYLWFLIDNAVFFFVIPAIIYYLRKKRLNKEQIALVSVLILSLAYFMIAIPRKEVRYLTIALYPLAFFASVGIEQVRKKQIFKKYALPTLVMILLLLSLLSLNWESNKLPLENKLIDIVKQREGGVILSSHPYTTLFDNWQSILFEDAQSIWVLYNSLKRVDIIYFNDCTLTCPLEDANCKEEKERFIEYIKQNYELKERKIVKSCEVLILSNE